MEKQYISKHLIVKENSREYFCKIKLTNNDFLNFLYNQREEPYNNILLFDFEKICLLLNKCK